ncbi:MAG: hypothetical protein HC925_00015 [Coleofasciculaceae cyanobacterium SM2_3_26]|nr:hypothetical protein [Coleofasciculaceae cyanobacterium SM2_3_26]
MPTITDTIGTWRRDSADLLPDAWVNLTEHRFFDLEFFGTYSIFRFTHEYREKDWEQAGIWGYAWFRFVYLTGADTLVSPAQRIHPKIPPEIRQIEYPAIVLEPVGLAARAVQLKRYTRYKRGRYPSIESDGSAREQPPWRITVDYLLPS